MSDMRSLTLIALSLMLLGCAMRRTAQTKQVMESWDGRNISDVINSWGPPSQVYDCEGLKCYVWRADQSHQAPGRTQKIDYGSGVEQTVVYPGRTRNWSEYREFRVDGEGNIVYWRFGSQ